MEKLLAERAKRKARKQKHVEIEHVAYTPTLTDDARLMAEHKERIAKLVADERRKRILTKWTIE